jgi:hypothetical protein
LHWYIGVIRLPSGPGRMQTGLACMAQPVMPFLVDELGEGTGSDRPRVGA